MTSRKYSALQAEVAQRGETLSPRKQIGPAEARAGSAVSPRPRPQAAWSQNDLLHYNQQAVNAA